MARKTIPSESLIKKLAKKSRERWQYEKSFRPETDLSVVEVEVVEEHGFRDREIRNHVLSLVSLENAKERQERLSSRPWGGRKSDTRSSTPLRQKKLFE